MSADLSAFLVAKRAAGLSPLTTHWYEKFLGRYLAWCEENKLPIKKPETVEGFLSDLRARKLSPYTISGCYRSLNAYYKWLVQRGKLKSSPMALVQRPKVPKTRKKHVTDQQFKQLYGSITGQTWLDYRDRAILQILMFSGLRAQEIVNLTLDSVDRERYILHVRQGKGGHDRDVPFAPDMLIELDGYLERRPPANTDALFIACSGVLDVPRGPLTFYGLTTMIRRRCTQAGMPRIGLHAFRHGYAMLFLNEGEMELAAVSKTLGHSSVDLTRRFYADFETTSLRREYGKALRRIQDAAD